MMEKLIKFEDKIWKVKLIINELSSIEGNYFSKLVDEMCLSMEGEDHLFEYIFNYNDEYEDFGDYLSCRKITGSVFKEEGE
jgi:hypothetical protein